MNRLLSAREPVAAEHLAAIESAIEELESEEALHAPGQPPRYFARFSIAEQEPWIEIVLARAAVVNLWYPFDDEPQTVLREAGVEMPTPFQLIENAKPSCTFSIPRGPVSDLARFVDDLFLRLYAADEEYALEIEMCAFE